MNNLLVVWCKENDRRNHYCHWEIRSFGSHFGEAQIPQNCKLFIICLNNPNLETYTIFLFKKIIIIFFLLQTRPILTSTPKEEGSLNDILVRKASSSSALGESRTCFISLFPSCSRLSALKLWIEVRMLYKRKLIRSLYSVSEEWFEQRYLLMKQKSN